METESGVCVDTKQISQAARAILQVAAKTCKSDLTNPLELQAISLQLCFKKIPNMRNNTLIKIPLPTPITHSITDICLFVKDLDKSTRDHESTIRHCKELLESSGIKRHIEVVPVNVLKLEYRPHEAKRNLSNMYDLFLADSRIVRLLPKLLGKHFLGRKKFPFQVNMEAKDLKKEFDKVLTTTQCVLSGRGSNCQVAVAHTGMSASQIAKNIEIAVHKLANSIPGGMNNIRNIHVRTINSPSLPIYISEGNRADVTLPQRQRKPYVNEPEDVTPVRNALVTISKYGRIRLIKAPREDAEEGGAVVEEDEDEGPLIEGSDDEADKSDDEAAPKTKKRRQNKDRPSKGSNRKRAGSPDNEHSDTSESSENTESGSGRKEIDSNVKPRGEKRKSVASETPVSQKASLKSTGTENMSSNKRQKRTDKVTPKARRKSLRNSENVSNK